MKKILSKFYRKLRGNKIISKYKSKDYLEAYAEHTDERVKVDPRAAIGGMWDEIGSLQFEFLKSRGLKPVKTLLDIGCGTLRGGRHFIRFLETEGYTGMDISPKALDFAKQLLVDENLSEKNPSLVLSINKNLKFEEFNGKTFDFLLAQSVFTHLKPEHIEECIAHVGNIMHAESEFFFTIFLSEKYEEISHKDFSYPVTYFEELAIKYGFVLLDWSKEYLHPKKQYMLSIKKKK